MSKFNFFKGGVKVRTPNGTTTLEEVVAWIRSGVYKSQVALVRNAANSKEASFHKQQLDYVTFSGIFAPSRMAGNLVEHSGLIVIDFDHVHETEMLKIQLQQDPYVTACFVSPSGAGVKAIVRIKDSSRHKESFVDLAHYFNNVYRLSEKEKVDPSGSDVSRACFMSFDETAYINPTSKEYVIQSRIPEKPKSDQQVKADATETEKHIATIVERIEAHSMDICNDYGQEWLLIAFSLSTLGERGRQYFHRVSALNGKYNEADTDEKFDNALHTSRFTNAGKFFSICKDYGIDVSRPKKEPAPKAAKPEKKGKPEFSDAKNDNDQEKPKKGKKKRQDDELPEHWHETVWYTKSGGIQIKAGKYFDEVAPNFQVFIKYKTEDEQENVTWVLEIRMATGRSEFIEVIHDDFCSARKLKNMLATKRLGFKIKDGHLDELHSYLFTETEFSTATKVVRYGYHPASKVYFFANKAFNVKTQEMLSPDSFGIVEANKMHLSIPQPPKAKQIRNTLTDTNVTFGYFWQMYGTAHLPENGFVPVCFYIFSLFRDLALQYKNFSPILFLKGGAGTGKSSMVRVLTAAFGRKQEGVNLKGKNTDASLVKLMSQSSNAIIWFDEFHNELTNEGLLQAAYDNDGYHKSTTDFNSIETAAVEIYSALALTSNYIPQNDIFFSRCVFIPITSQEKSACQREAFDKLEAIQEAGLGCLTIELLQYRELLESNDNYAISYNRIYKALKDRLKSHKIPERLIANMAQVMAAPYSLHVFGKINMLSVQSDNEQEILEEFVDVAENFIMRQFSIQRESTAASEFFQIVQGLFEAYTIQEGFHFRFQGDKILINFRKMYNLFAQKYRQTFFKTPPDRDTIQSELTTLSGQTEWDTISKTIRFMNDGAGNSQASTMPQTGSCELDYNLLAKQFGVDFKNRPQINM